MNCVIPGANLKGINKAIQALSKIGDDVYLKPTKDHLSLESINMTTTAYCIFRFHEAFFSSYEVADINTDSVEDLLCKFPAKAILGVFKLHGHKDKKPEYCKIELEHSSSTTITFKFKYKHDVMSVKSLYLTDGKVVKVDYNSDIVTNQVSATAGLYSKVLSNFQISDEDISIDFTCSKAVLRNYITGDLNGIRGIRSQISLLAAEFNTFKIDKETNITFSLKPFRAAIHVAESFNLAVVLNFEAAGKPAILVIKNPTFEGNFIMATLKSEDDMQSTLSSAILKPGNIRLKSKKPNGINITVQDQQALDSCNWDNDFEDQSSKKKKGKFDDIIAKLNEERDKTLKNDVLYEKDDVIANSPESSQGKRIRSIFGRCYEETFHATLMDLGDVLAPDSDPDST